MSLLRRIEQGQQTTTKGARMQVRRQPAAPARDAYMDLKARIQNKLISGLDPTMDVTRTDEVRHTIEEMYNNILAEEKIPLSRTERQRLFELIVAEILGFGVPESSAGLSSKSRNLQSLDTSLWLQVIPIAYFDNLISDNFGSKRPVFF